MAHGFTVIFSILGSVSHIYFFFVTCSPACDYGSYYELSQSCLVTFLWKFEDIKFFPTRCSIQLATYYDKGYYLYCTNVHVAIVPVAQAYPIDKVFSVQWCMIS